MARLDVRGLDFSQPIEANGKNLRGSALKLTTTSILRSVREERATRKIGKRAIGPPGWLEKGSSASLLVRYGSQRMRSSLAPSTQTLLKPTVCLLLMRRCTSFGL